MKISCISQIAPNGLQYITVNAEEPGINYRNLWHGGKCFCFDLDHKKQTTTVSSYWWNNGTPTGWKKLAVEKENIFSEKECLQWVENYMKGKGAKA